MSSNISSKNVASGQVAAPQPPTAPTPRLWDVAKQRVSRGELGSLPVVLTLLIIAVYFQIASAGFFIKPINLSNLMIQIPTTGVLGLASVLVLLLGEIDLSLAAVANTCGAVMVTFSVYQHFNAVAALAMGLLAGALIGFINGVLIAVLRVPSFIVTLAGFIFYSGLVLHMLLPQTTVRLADSSLQALAGSYLDDRLTIALPLIALALYAFVIIHNRMSRVAQGLRVAPIWDPVLRIVIVGVVLVLAIVLFENAFGLPISVAILIGLITLFWLILRFTAFGRHVYAVGGNAEASRRAGISVVGIRIAVFTLASTLGAVGGILQSSRTISASAQVDPSLLLNAIAAAVIGGVSLFGGRGSAWAVALGVLVIGSLANGLALLSQGQDIALMVEGAVLIVAVTADALARRRSTVSGR